MAHDTSKVDEQDKTYFRELSTVYDAVDNRLGGRVAVTVLEIPIPVAFSVAFSRLFLGDHPHFKTSEDSYNASRSNWTYHTALAIAQASKLMNLTCKFEAFGKRDAVIETIGEHRKVVVIAEWEWMAEDVFGKGKELEKLRDSCRQNSHAAGFLLTYCSEASYPDYLKRVAEYWLDNFRRRKMAPILYLHTIIYRDVGSGRDFKFLRTADIDHDSVQLWTDQPFD